MDSKEIAKDFYNALGEDLMKHVDPGQLEDEIRYLVSFLPPGSTVLDVGCGYGRVGKALNRLGYDVQGCDISQEMITLANDERFIVADMMNLPYENKQFDSTLCLWSAFNSMLTLDDQIGALNEFLRVTKENILIDLPDGDDLSHATQRRRKGTGEDDRLVPNYFQGPKNIIYVHTWSSMRKLCEALDCKSFKLSRETFGGRRRLLVKLNITKS